MTASTRRRLTAEERRAGILDAALAVFSARGYHPSSIDDIAREAGISKALIYEHFDSKQGSTPTCSSAVRTSCSSGSSRPLPTSKSSRGPRASPPVSTPSSPSSRSAVTPGESCSADVADPDTGAVLDRILEQATGVISAQDPGVRRVDQDDPQGERAIRLLAQMLVGAVQSVANWWVDHREVPRDQIVEMVMVFAWLGLDRLSRGERRTPPGA